MDARNDGAVTPVLLNVYDLTPVNDYLYWLGFGVFHSGIEGNNGERGETNIKEQCFVLARISRRTVQGIRLVHGVEYGFGAHGFPSSGVFEVGSKSCPGFVYRRSVWLGTTDMSQEEFRSFIEKLAGKYHGNSYHLISKNCNHFTDDVCKNLTGKTIPGWVNRLARVGSFFDCLLPESVQVSPVGRVPTLRPISDDDLDSISSSLIGDSDEDDEDKHLLPVPFTDLHSVDVPLKLAKDLL